MKRACCIFLVIFFVLSGVKVEADEIGITIDMLPWDKANHVLPKYSKFIVLDVETGKKFNVQRRAGSNHADVQPLTSKDTAIMKSVYNGQWSWKRRAIIVIYGERWIAASMHGMPHGGGALQNNFPGHFCIHFFGSTTHRTNEMDLSHKLMVLKAAGNLEGHLATADPYELVNSFLAGFKQQDIKILHLISLQRIKWDKIVLNIENVKITRVYMLPPEDLSTELYLSIPIEIDWYIKNEGRKRQKTEVHLLRFSPFDSWKVDGIHFIEGNNFLIK